MTALLRLPALGLVAALASCAGGDSVPVVGTGGDPAAGRDADSPVAPLPLQPWREGEGHRWRALTPVGAGRVGFTRMAAATTGISFENELTDEALAANTLLINGGGVAAGDVDGDGRIDLYLPSIESDNRLYRNLGGWRFEDVTRSSGTGCPDRWSCGATFADLDGDGDLDLLVTATGGPNAGLRNDGHGHFTDVTDEIGLSSHAGSTTITLADVEGDGDLDLYIACYRAQIYLEMVPPPRVYKAMVGGQELIMPKKWRDRLVVYRGEIKEIGETDRFYANDGAGVFSPIPFDGGRFLDHAGRIADAPTDWGLTAAFRDLDDDGRPDLYVCNDFWTPDRIWMNTGGLTFQEIDPLALRTTSKFSMAVDVADIDRDGHQDVFVADMLSRDRARRQRQAGVAEKEPVEPGRIDVRQQTPHNTLQWARGDGTYAEISQAAGVDASEWTWSSIFCDVDLDGYEDLLIASGTLYDPMDSDAAYLQMLAGEEKTRAQILQSFPPLATPNIAFRNRGDRTFEEVGAAWGFDATEVSNGMALADLDDDGDMDVVVSHLNAPVSVYRNDSPAPRVAVRLQGAGSNSQGVGARVRLLGAGAPQTREITAGGHFLSHSDTMASFAAPAGATDLVLEVRWPGGKRSVVEGVLADRLYEILESGATSPDSSPADERAPVMFEDVSDTLDHAHVDTGFDDFARQPLLPRRLSHLGPGVLLDDLDGDGDDDIAIGTGAGGRLAVLEGDGAGGFVPLETDGLLSRDLTGLVVTPAAAGSLLLAGSAAYEDGDGDAPALVSWRVVPGACEAAGGLVELAASAGPLAAGDLDGDGTLEVVIGGRVAPGAYPRPCDALVLRSSGGALALDPVASRPLAGVGMTSGAVMADLDGDGDVDLALALEWGAIRVFENRDGALVDATDAVGLTSATGWWNGISAGDLDGDGALDLIATGWGINHRRYKDHDVPRLVLHGDVDSVGAYDVIEAHLDRGVGKVVPEAGLRELMAAIPSVPSRIRMYRQFADASVEEIFGPAAQQMQRAEARMTEHVVLLSRGPGSLGGGERRFEVAPLPWLAQVSPAFGVVIADLDGDGDEDAFLAQNFFGVEALESRHDAGRGVLLLGDGAGGFEAIDAPRSGISCAGEGRGVAAGDFDRDGRVDLLIGQNRERTLLYRNRAARPGVRIRLAGPAGNPAAIGAVMRWRSGERAGPARPVLAGSGYWSTSSRTQVLARPADTARLEVRWPGGQLDVFEIPASATAVEIDPSGQVRDLTPR